MSRFVQSVFISVMLMGKAGGLSDNNDVGATKFHHWPPYNKKMNSLRDGKEIVVHLTPGIEAEYYFHVKKDASPFWLTVTPCGGMVNWKLTVQNGEKLVSSQHTIQLHSEIGLETAGVTAHENSNYNKIVTTIPKIFPGLDGRMLAVENPPEPLINHQALKTNQLSEYPFTRRSETVLVHEVGKEKMEYYAQSLPKGILHYYAKRNGI